MVIDDPQRLDGDGSGEKAGEQAQGGAQPADRFQKDENDGQRSAGAMPRLVNAIAAVASTPAISFGQPCGMIIAPTVMRISVQEKGSTQS